MPSLLPAPRTSSCLTDEGTEAEMGCCLPRSHGTEWALGWAGLPGQRLVPVHAPQVPGLPGPPLPACPPYWPPGGARDPEVALCPCHAHIPGLPAPVLGSGTLGSDSRPTLWSLPRGCHRSWGHWSASGLWGTLGTGRPTRYTFCSKTPHVAGSHLPPDDLRNCRPPTRCPRAVPPTTPSLLSGSHRGICSRCSFPQHTLPPSSPNLSLHSHLHVAAERSPPPGSPLGSPRAGSGAPLGAPSTLCLPSQLCSHHGPAMLQGGRLLPTPARAGHPLQAWPERARSPRCSCGHVHCRGETEDRGSCCGQEVNAGAASSCNLLTSALGFSLSLKG